MRRSETRSSLRFEAPAAIGAAARATAAILLASGLAAASAPALARGGNLTPPAGQLAATAPGGTQGLAGPGNVEEAVRSGRAYGVSRGPLRRYDRIAPAPERRRAIDAPYR